jgi:hypothetical protein
MNVCVSGLFDAATGRRCGRYHRRSVGADDRGACLLEVVKHGRHGRCVGNDPTDRRQGQDGDGDAAPILSLLART